jgi:hypothetical protein
MVGSEAVAMTGRMRAMALAIGQVAVVASLVGCGSSAGSATSAGAPTAAATTGSAPSEPAAAPSDLSASGDPGNGSGNGGGPIGGDIGDRSKGSAQAQISGGLTASVDLPFAAAAAQLLAQGPGTAYLPFTDPTNGTLFLTITEGGLLVQYAGPEQVGLTNGGTPCELHIDTLDAKSAKGTFTCKGMLLVKNDGMGNADMTGSFEGHQ